MFTDGLNVLTRCAGQLFKVNRAQACVGYMAFDAAEHYTIDQDTQVEHVADDLPIGLVEEIAAIQRVLLHQKFSSRNDQIIFPHTDNPFGINITGQYIKNVRVVPIVDPLMIYAVMFLINVSNESLANKQNTIRPFVTATANLFSIKQIRNYLPQQRESLVALSHLGVADILSHVYHPVIVFNQNMEILKYNRQSMLMVQQSALEKTEDMGELLTYFARSTADDIVRNVTNYEFSRKLQKNEWKDIAFKINAFQSIQVDMRLVVAANAIKTPEYTKTDGSSLKKVVQFALLINDNKRSELHSLQRFQALTSLIPLGILQLSKEFECIYANDTWSKITSLTLSNSLKEGWAKCFESQDLHRLVPEMRRLNVQNREYGEELQLTSSMNDNKWVSVKSVGLFDEQGKIDGYILTIDDISQIRAQKEALESLANTDSLTGISNRACFHDRLRVAISRVDRHDNAAILFIDLDKFKNINDTYGHNAGDEVIQKVAKRLHQLVRKEDTIARLGGDEFAVIVSDVMSDADMVNLAVKIIIEVSKPMQVEKNTLKVECSIGIAPIKSSRLTIKTVLKHADLAVYKAKALGRNQFCMYTESLERESLLANYLRSSLEEDKATGFFIDYQPQVDSRTHQIVGIEALSRWNHPADELVSPQEFILQLETHGLINDFFVWQLSDMLPLAKKWADAGIISPSRRLSFNLSALQLHVSDLSVQLLKNFDDYGLDITCFGLEVTETAFMDDPIGAGNNLKRLRDAGFKIALDDFGTGFSSLSLLRNMPLDIIKIDKEFIIDVLTNSVDATIVQSIIMLGSKLELEVVAEGVENELVTKWLVDNGCPVQQGFYLFEPMSPKELEDCLYQTMNQSA